MARTDGDSWDIATSVGATAVMVALARAQETASDDPLIRDEFAEVLVSTPELDGVRAEIASWGAPDGDDDPEGAAIAAQQMIDYQAVRTHFFDEFFASAAAAGIRQHVILAAGLDSRAYRLSWPAGSVVYEIDLPKVLEYKVATLASHGAEPVTTRRDVPVDLREDWPKALRDKGFDGSAPTTWLAEGLLPFLPAQAQESMFTAIDELSVPGSRISLEAFGFAEFDRDEIQERWEKRRAALAARGEDSSFSPLDLWYDDADRPDSAAWFAEHSWKTTSTESPVETRRLGRGPQSGQDGPAFSTTFVTAVK
jgi:methyltransferase (TIGR00027 family)